MRLPRLSNWVSARVLLAWMIFLSPLATASAETAGRDVFAVDVLTNESVVAANLRPKQLLAAPESQLLPIEVAEAFSTKFLGIEASRIIDVGVVVEPPLGTTPFYAIVLQADRPFDLDELHSDITAHTTAGQLADKDCLLANEPMLPCILALDNNRLLVGSAGMLKKLLDPERERANCRLASLMQERGPGDDLFLAVDIEAIRPLIQLALMQVPHDFPADAQKYLTIPPLLASLELAWSLTDSRRGMIVLRTETDEEADQLETLAADGIEYFKAKIRATIDNDLAKFEDSDDPVERAFAAYGNRLFNLYVGLLSPTRDGKQFRFFDGEGGNQLGNADKLATIGILAALLLPAIQAARNATQRNQSLHKAKQLIVALQNYHATHGEFPPHAIYSEDGSPLLSWRVLLLPFLGEAKLYERFQLDQPWDSPHNAQLIASMPDVFLTPGSDAPSQEGRTCCLAIVGKDLFFSGTNSPREMRDFTDGLSNTIAIVEVGQTHAVPWTKPADWTLDEGDPLHDVEDSPRPGNFACGFADGSARLLSKSIAEDVWRGLLTIAGGEPIGLISE